MASSDIPHEIIFEVLTRASLQVLGTTRVISKELNKLTYDSYFTHLHRQRTKTISGYFVQGVKNHIFSSTFVSDYSDYSSNVSLNFLSVPLTILASCKQGLLFCVGQNPQSNRNCYVPNFYVCKPSTRQWQLIPNPKTKYMTYSTAIMVLKLKPLHYKIVRFSQTKSCHLDLMEKGNRIRCDVFDSKLWKWKMLEEVKLLDQELLNCRPAISAGGESHWLTNQDRIFSFNADQETWTISSLPAPLDGDKYYERKYLAEYEGRLALSCMVDYFDNKEIDIWIRDDTNYWSHKQTIDTTRVQQRPIFQSFDNADVAVFKDYAELLYLNFKKCSCDAVKMKKHPNPDHIFEFQSDLEPTNLKGVVEISEL